jgi:hypothetical protein
MAELKTKPTNISVETYLNNITDEQRRRDCCTILDIMKKAAGKEPVMWGNNIVGFGSYHYKYQSGREGDWFLTGFSSAKNHLTLYIMSGFQNYEELLSKLGKYKTGQSCLYIKNLKNLDINILTELINQSLRDVSGRYPPVNT